MIYIRISTHGLDLFPNRRNAEKEDCVSIKTESKAHNTELNLTSSNNIINIWISSSA